MSNYKVPQDVEADDKVLGPLSFRQFLYLGIVAACIGISIPLANIALPLGLILLPVILLFGALALPLRKDQPMETYLAALIQFILKPHKRIWDQEIEEATLIIDATKQEGVARTKNMSAIEAKQRLSYLSALVDTPNINNFRDDFYAEAIYATDILDPNASYIRLESKLSNVDREQKELAIAKMKRFLSNNRPPEAATPAPRVSGRIINPTGDVSNASLTASDYHDSDLPISVIEQRLNQKQGEYGQQ
ncbi:PrgI family protein [Candidatus Saccharibacteria bacterium]|nr:PrgI family protein [Candidatus Saccharibacteria bacterium]